MAPRSAMANISFTVDSASEDEMTQDELNALPTPESNAENKAPAKKARGKAAQTKTNAPATKATAKGKTATRRVSGSSVLGPNKTNAAVAKKAPAKTGRKALAERNAVNGSDTEEVDDFEEEEAAALAKTTKRGRPAKVQKAQDEEMTETAAPAKRGRKLAAKKETKARAKTSKHVEEDAEPATIPETQPELDVDEMDVEDSIEIDDVPESMPPPPRPSARRAQGQAQPSRARQTSAGARRAGSASDSERDPALRRKVGDLTRKLEAMTVKYDTLKETASGGKESNFDQLKKRTEQTAKDQDAVIKALRQQMAELQSRTSDLTSMKKELAAMSKENTRLTSENKKLTDSLTTAQNENKNLSNKLAAARSSVQPESRNVPGSAVKPRSNGVVLPGAPEAAKEAQLAKQKVDLYSDFTDLVVLGVKRNEDEEDVYDCLQTGGGRTLHFHLTVATPASSSEPTAFEDTEFVYQPLLDEQRDKELLDLLPDYLTEEICFPRGQAPKFYRKVLDSMARKIEFDDEE
ncbi:chromosome segregation protein Csm1/Pcs1-domain-containing protein [Phaeosphaeria sp. MPI-PUGE-AT-0046c]|nr:chromosome segregation protein Csm1/Pcs1-domain-containing protein [Phaeosphaeria sp. MPI-PUGE-AT-0046c]